MPIYNGTWDLENTSSHRAETRLEEERGKAIHTSNLLHKGTYYPLLLWWDSPYAPPVTLHAPIPATPLLTHSVTTTLREYLRSYRERHGVHTESVSALIPRAQMRSL